MTHPSTRAAAFHQLHTQGVLVLANIWDAGSARLVQSLGAPALATTSAALAWALGYADGNHLPVDMLAQTVARITRVIKVPLSVDSEGGYSDDPAAVGEAIGRLVDEGAVGINLEDSTKGTDLLCAKIEQAKRAGEQRGVNLFVNARTDVYLRELVPPAQRLEETLVRAARYQAAGADGLFVPYVLNPDEIRAIVAGTPLPLNVLARPGLPPLAQLAELGVRRLSAGSGVAQALYGRMAALAGTFLQEGVSEPLAEGAMTYAQINDLIGAE